MHSRLSEVVKPSYVERLMMRFAISVVVCPVSSIWERMVASDEMHLHTSLKSRSGWNVMHHLSSTTMNLCQGKVSIAW